MAGWMRCSESSTTTTSSSSTSSLSSRSNRESRTESRSVDSDSDSPPSYVVVEDRHGNLISKALNVIWPQRPEKGRYSLDEYNKRKAHEKELQRRKERSAKKRAHERRKNDKIEATKDDESVRGKLSSMFSEGDHRTEKFEPPISKFVGVMASSQVRRLLRPTEFRLYYACPETISSLAEVPIRMPLKLVYMSSSGKLYQFSFNETLSRKGSMRWQLDLGPFNTQKQPIFKSLQALIKYYECYANIRRQNGSIETFPFDEK